MHDGERKSDRTTFKYGKNCQNLHLTKAIRLIQKKNSELDLIVPVVVRFYKDLYVSSPFYFRQNFLEVDIFYKSLRYVVETHKPAYSIHAFISKYSV